MSNRELSFNAGDRQVPVEYLDSGFGDIGARISALLTQSNARVLLVTDELVALHYAQQVRDSLEAAGMQTFIHSFPPGEREKTMARAQTVLDILVTRQFERSDMIVALGGGVVSDLAGFAAAIYMRGIVWIALPTSLLAMVDASIGGKTGVNHPMGKNLLGAFYPPLAVFASAPALKTLPPREMLSGSAEVVKHGLLHGGALWEQIEKRGPDLTSWSDAQRLELLPECALVKIEVVSEDPRESHRRMILNLGHTFGHAIETVLGYSGITHGEAVFLGLRAMLRLSERAGLLDGIEAMRLDDTLRKAPYPALTLSPERLIEALHADKKLRSRKLNWILLSQLGKPLITTEVAEADVQAVAEWLCVAAAEGWPQAAIAARPRMLILNGPNLNLLGSREPDVYGEKSHLELEAELHAAAARYECEILIRQSNSEGELVSLIQCCRHWAEGIVINPGGYTHSSVAIRDAIAAVKLPAIEVHLSDIPTREEFRRDSLITPVCSNTISGKSFGGYIEAIEELKALIIRRN